MFGLKNILDEKKPSRLVVLVFTSGGRTGLKKYRQKRLESHRISWSAASYDPSWAGIPIVSKSCPMPVPFPNPFPNLSKIQILVPKYQIAAFQLDPLRWKLVRFQRMSAGSSASLPIICPTNVCQMTARWSAELSSRLFAGCSLDVCRIVRWMSAGFWKCYPTDIWPTSGGQSVTLLLDFKQIPGRHPADIQWTSDRDWGRHLLLFGAHPVDIQQTSGKLPADPTGRQGFGIWDSVFSHHLQPLYHFHGRSWAIIYCTLKSRQHLTSTTKTNHSIWRDSDVMSKINIYISNPFPHLLTD